MINEILNSYDLHLEHLRGLVADLDGDQLVCQPNNVPNHPAWTIGHLVYSCQAIGGELGVEPWLPEDWETRFGTGSTPTADAAAYCRQLRTLPGTANRQVLPVQHDDKPFDGPAMLDDLRA
ncbi:MAG: DinB family protein, partial [Fuerstiella sp.]